MSKIWTWLHSADWITWAGHAAQAVLIFYLFAWGWGEMAGLAAVIGAFGHRELSDMLNAYAAGGVAAVKKKIPDSFADFTIPLVALGIVRGIVGLI